MMQFAEKQMQNKKKDEKCVELIDEFEDKPFSLCFVNPNMVSRTW